MLIQRAKAFQANERRGTVGKKNLLPKQRIEKVTGRTFHLLLSKKETLESIYEPHETINKKPGYFITVRSLPKTTSKAIWETKANVDKLFLLLPC